MQRYRKCKLADMHLVYGIAEGNGEDTEKNYRERFPDKHQPHNSSFARVHQCLLENRSLKCNECNEKKSGWTLSLIILEIALDAMESTPSTNKV